MPQLVSNQEFLAYLRKTYPQLTLDELLEGPSFPERTVSGSVRRMLEQRLRFFQNRCTEALGEPSIDCKRAFSAGRQTVR